MRPRSVSPERLRELYEDQRISPREIGRIVGLDLEAVHRELARAGVLRRRRAEVLPCPRQIRRIGNSSGILLPVAALRLLGWDDGTAVLVSVEEGRLYLSPAGGKR